MKTNERWHHHFAGCIAEQADGEYGDSIGITTASEEDFRRTGDRGDLVAWVPCDRKHEETARLITAAPELLDTLRFLLPLLRRTAEKRPEWDCWGINLHLEAAEEVERAIEIATGAKEGAA